MYQQAIEHGDELKLGDFYLKEALRENVDNTVEERSYLS